MHTRFKHEVNAHINETQKNLNKFDSNSGVIFIEGSEISRENAKNSTFRRKEEKTYWFQKYLQDLQKRGTSQKIIKRF